MTNTKTQSLRRPVLASAETVAHRTVLTIVLVDTSTPRDQIDLICDALIDALAPGVADTVVDATPDPSWSDIVGSEYADDGNVWA